MTVYNVVLFAHISCVMVMFASLTADGLAIGGLRSVASAGPARVYVRILRSRLRSARGPASPSSRSACISPPTRGRGRAGSSSEWPAG